MKEIAYQQDYEGFIAGVKPHAAPVLHAINYLLGRQSREKLEAFRAAHPDFDLNALRMVVYAAVLILLMVFNPRGIFGENELFGWGGRKNAPKKVPAT